MFKPHTFAKCFRSNREANVLDPIVNNVRAAKIGYEGPYKPRVTHLGNNTPIFHRILYAMHPNDITNEEIIKWGHDLIQAMDDERLRIAYAGFYDNSDSANFKNGLGPETGTLWALLKYLQHSKPIIREWESLDNFLFKDDIDDIICTNFHVTGDSPTWPQAVYEYGYKKTFDEKACQLV